MSVTIVLVWDRAGLCVSVANVLACGMSRHDPENS